MGHFLAVSAVKTNDVEGLAENIDKYAKENGVKSQRLEGKVELSEDRHVLVFPPENGWCVVLWPAYFNIHDVPAAKYLSENLNALVSSVNVYDGDYWCHSFFDSGVQIDSYCSMPGYWAENDKELKENIEKYKGCPAGVAQKLDISIERIEGYYKHIIEDIEYSKVNDSDEFEIDDFWVFTDFWNCLGIEYPEDMEAYSSIIDLTRFFSKNE